MRGGPGDDNINGRGDAATDAVSCGPGEDTVLADSLDVVATDCERLKRALPLGTAPTPVTIEFLGWAGSNVNLTSFPASVPASAVPSGGR
jgi:hypothetical protein